MSFRSLNYLVVFYYQAIYQDKDGTIFPILFLLTRPLSENGRLPLCEGCL